MGAETLTRMRMFINTRLFDLAQAEERIRVVLAAASLGNEQDIPCTRHARRCAPSRETATLLDVAMSQVRNLQEASPMHHAETTDELKAIGLPDPRSPGRRGGGSTVFAA